MKSCFRTRAEGTATRRRHLRDPGLGHHEVRLAYVLNVETLQRAVGLLAEALNVYQEMVAA
ncbi:MAG TPA: hypothetical protein DEV93_18815 [Chloroflexi bacterium]|nr:hypothetical protein [Chloroflexota bacterium]